MQPAPKVVDCHATGVCVQSGLRAEKPAPVQPVAQAWDEGYRAGIDDERTSEANIGIAGMGMKVEPARNNPYHTTPPTQPAPVPKGSIQHLKTMMEESAWEGGLDLSDALANIDEFYATAQPAPVVDCHATGVCVQSGLRAEKPAPVQQEPVAWLKRHELADLQTCNHRRLGADSPRIWAPNAPDAPPPELDLVAVYTTPPAAAVPDAIGPNEDELPAYAAGWNDCRQAMLEMMK
jgi:hypothetical protein